MNGELNTRQDVHMLAGAYALDAIDDEMERRRFEAHLDGCPSCAQEVAGLAETAARLGQATAATPPPELKGRVLAEIGQVRQLAPTVARPQGSRRASADRKVGARVAAAMAAVGLVAAAVLGVLAYRAHTELEELRSANRQVAAVLAAPDARLAGTTERRGVEGTVVLSRSAGRMVFLASGLQPLPDDKTYQLWQLTPGRAHPAGLLRPDEDGYTAPALAVSVPGATAVGLTVEPAGGSAAPTTAPLLVMEMPTG
ncbi:anti-sigma factor domain-containing protein [Nonomuraea sp. NPDC059194]|uniref:anti-sigma factor n=1 Tax=Nonomuraea sp. NPDC059194 TaxID=3346764 RepID=UPI0036AED954